VQERAREVNRVQGVRERATIKLASVVSDIMGVSGRAMIEALRAGKADPAAMAALAKRRMWSKLLLLEQALTGIVRDHHRQLFAMQLAHMDFLDDQIEALSAAIQTWLGTLSTTEVSPSPAPGLPEDQRQQAADVPQPLTFTQAVELLDTILGVDQRGAAMLVAEIGRDMTRFGTAPR